MLIGIARNAQVNPSQPRLPVFTRRVRWYSTLSQTHASVANHVRPLPLLDTPFVEAGSDERSALRRDCRQWVASFSTKHPLG